MADAIVSAAYDDLPETCRRYLADAHARRHEAARGLRWMEQRPMAEFLRPVLDGGAVPVDRSPATPHLAAQEPRR
jgi:hypothetical protein